MAGGIQPIVLTTKEIMSLDHLPLTRIRFHRRSLQRRTGFGGMGAVDIKVGREKGTGEDGDREWKPMMLLKRGLRGRIPLHPLSRRGRVISMIGRDDSLRSRRVEVGMGEGGLREVGGDDESAVFAVPPDGIAWVYSRYLGSSDDCLFSKNTHTGEILEESVEMIRSHDTICFWLIPRTSFSSSIQLMLIRDHDVYTVTLSDCLQCT
jgi:hypothetical protein